MATLQIQLGRIRRQANSNLASQQQVSATLYAIEETLKEQGGQPSPSSYFASLLTLLEQQQGLNNGLHEPILYLLAIVLPFTPQPVLRAKFTTIMGILSSSVDMSQADAPIIRSVVKILETLLSVLDANGWKQTIAIKSFQSVLILGTDPRPKVRKTAQDAAALILSRSPPPLAQHPASGTVATFCLNSLQASNSKDPQALIHLLQLIKATIPGWPTDKLAALCDPLIQLPKLNNNYITTSAFDAFGAIFEYASENLENKNVQSLLSIIVDMKPNINDVTLSSSWHKIISHGYTAYAKSTPDACYATLPDIFDIVFNDLELGKPAAQQTAANTLRTLLFKCIPKSDTLLDGEEIIIARLVKTLTSGLGYRFKTVWSVILLLIAVAFDSYGLRAHPSMDSLLELVSSLRMEPDFELKAEADATLGTAVSAIGPEAFLSVLPLNIDAVTGKAKNVIGRAWLLPLMKGYIKNTPLQYFVDTLLPIADRLASQRDEFSAKNRVVESRVFDALCQQVWALFSGFCDAPIDVTTKFDSEFAARLGKDIHESPNTRPYICTGLQKMTQSIHKLATEKKDSMTDDKEDGDHDMSTEKAKEAERHLSQFSPNFLLVLFNVFSQTASPSRGYLFETIQSLLLITSQDEINSAFERVHGMFTNSLASHTPPTSEQLTKQYIEANPPPVAHTMLDLLIAMLSSINREKVDTFIQTILPLINQSEDTTLQKKAYKALYKLCDNTESTKAASESIAQALVPTLIPALVEATNNTASGSRRERLSLLALLIKVLPSSDLHVIPSLLSEAIISTKEVNERARGAAFDLLLSLAYKMQKGGVVDTSKLMPEGAGGDQDDDDDEMDEGSKNQASLEEFFKMALAGLAATTQHMISATITSLARLMFEFHTKLRPEFMIEILDTTLMFVDTNSREIAKSSLGFVKVAVVALPNETLEPFLKKLVHGVLKWSNEHKNRLKVKARHIIERLVRRFGLEPVSKVTPEEHYKLINNIRKRKMRAAKKSEEKAKNDDDEEAEEGIEKLATGKKSKYGNAYEDALYGSESEISDSENEDAMDEDRGRNGKKQKGGKKLVQDDPWIHEDANGPLDFLDRKAFSHMSTSKPSDRPKSKSLAKEFKVKDGRLVIEDEESDTETQAANENKGGAAAANKQQGPDYYKQMVQSKDGFTRGQNNRIKFNKRKSGEFNDNDDEDGMDVDSNERQEGNNSRKSRSGAGGKGIGREYRAKGAGGDRVKKGKFEPYAYIPLNPSKVNSKQKNLGIKNTSKRDKRKSGGGRA